jgi:hypothetical protein
VLYGRVRQICDLGDIVCDWPTDLFHGVETHTAYAATNPARQIAAGHWAMEQVNGDGPLLHYVDIHEISIQWLSLPVLTPLDSATSQYTVMSRFEVISPGGFIAGDPSALNSSNIIMAAHGVDGQWVSATFNATVSGTIVDSKYDYHDVLTAGPPGTYKVDTVCVFGEFGFGDPKNCRATTPVESATFTVPPF